MGKYNRTFNIGHGRNKNQLQLEIKTFLSTLSTIDEIPKYDESKSMKRYLTELLTTHFSSFEFDDQQQLIGLSSAYIEQSYAGALAKGNINQLENAIDEAKNKSTFKELQLKAILLTNDKKS